MFFFIYPNHRDASRGLKMYVSCIHFFLRCKKWQYMLHIVKFIKYFFTKNDSHMKYAFTVICLFGVCVNDR